MIMNLRNAPQNKTPGRMLPTVSVIIASSQTGATCVRELLTTYAGRVNVRAVFRTEERAAPLRAAFGDRGDLEVVVGVDATNPTSPPRSLAPPPHSSSPRTKWSTASVRTATCRAR